MAKDLVTPQAAATYRSLMQEIKYRTEAIDNVLSAKTTPLRAKLAEEFCYLQFRMICELIAIGCLVVHGNLKPKADLFKTHKADWIMAELEKLHPKFFPTPLESKDEQEVDGNPKWVEKKSGFLTKDEVKTLWNRECGSKLHRGTAKNILVKDPPLDFPRVRRWRDKIIRLLERHTIISPDEEQIFYVVMTSIDSGNVASNLFQRLD